MAIFAGKAVMSSILRIIRQLSDVCAEKLSIMNTAVIIRRSIWREGYFTKLKHCQCKNPFALLPFVSTL
jgi:hypothetical protein